MIAAKLWEKICRLRQAIRHYPLLEKLIYPALYVFRTLKYRTVRARPLIPPPGHRFPAGFINVNDPFVQAAWPHLIKGYDDEEYWREAIQKLRYYTMCSYDALLSLADQVRHLERIGLEGAFVEAGTWRGGTAGLMALACLRYGGGGRRLHLFDSFLGLPRPDGDHDDREFMTREFHVKEGEHDGALTPINALEASLEELEEAVFQVAAYPRELVEVHKGWFQDTVPPAAKRIGPIALLRLDGDLYDSYTTCLEHLYPLVVEGGLVIIDDWCLKGCRAAVEDYFRAQGLSPYLSHVDACTHYFIKTSS